MIRPTDKQNKMFAIAMFWVGIALAWYLIGWELALVLAVVFDAYHTYKKYE